MHALKYLHIFSEGHRSFWTWPWSLSMCLLGSRDSLFTCREYFQIKTLEDFKLGLRILSGIHGCHSSKLGFDLDHFYFLLFQVPMLCILQTFLRDNSISLYLCFIDRKTGSQGKFKGKKCFCETMLYGHRIFLITVNAFSKLHWKEFSRSCNSSLVLYIFELIIVSWNEAMLVKGRKTLYWL